MDTQIGAEGGTPDGYNYPNGYTQAYLLSGSWNTGFNRLTFSMNCSKSWPIQSTLSSVGTYIRDHGQTDPSFQGQHYYHYMANAVKSGVWYYFTLNGHPQHKVAQSPVINWPNNPEEVFPSFGTPINYYDGLTRWYINPYFSRDLTGTFACEWGPIAFGLVTDEPDEDVSTIASSYDGSTYHVDFAGPKNVTETYTVRCATSSMHTNGFGIGSTCGSSPSTQGNAYTYVNWAYTTPHVPALYVALRPHPVVIGATGNGVSPIILSFAVDPMYASGDQVTVTGVGGNTAANGTFNVTPIARRFWSFGNSSLTSVVVSGGIGTATTNSVHNLKAGQVVMVYHANDSGQWGYAPLYAVGSVPSTTTFTFSTGSRFGRSQPSTCKARPATALGRTAEA
jgi:hypothetical protein